MIIIALGVAVWISAHFFRFRAPNMNAVGKVAVAVLVLASISLMVVGFRGAQFIPVWQPPAFMGHINNVLMIFAFYVFGASAAKGEKAWLGTKIRRPQLVAISIWAVAHLLANGDLAAIILFGSMLIWALISIQVLNASQGQWDIPPRAGAVREIRLVVITVVLFLFVAAVHSALGVSPFGGV
ncbi:MAG: NnrU family protein [Litoreibacter sp.]